MDVHGRTIVTTLTAEDFRWAFNQWLTLASFYGRGAAVRSTAAVLSQRALSRHSSPRCLRSRVSAADHITKRRGDAMSRHRTVQQQLDAAEAALTRLGDCLRSAESTTSDARFRVLVRRAVNLEAKAHRLLHRASSTHREAALATTLFIEEPPE